LLKNGEQMRKDYLSYISFFAMVLFLSGCATVRTSDKDIEIQSLRNQVLLLESQVQSREEELNSLKDSLNRVSQEADRKIAKDGSSVESKCFPNIRNIQMALLNAGYNPGPIDGKMGKQTREAIKAFQKANNLAIDGKAGKGTWELLKKYLEVKVK